MNALLGAVLSIGFSAAASGAFWLVWRVVNPDAWGDYDGLAWLLVAVLPVALVWWIASAGHAAIERRRRRLT